ncbi:MULTISPECIES: D-glycerate dehydrogenase [Sphingopyxis]|uniref:2-hydroxyacid dehydrogenase n=1 Tax=Sphingopyxis TaxID=165697 RepID=UPI0016455511|nr:MULTISPECIES: D-glycerate dehydrogenase [Sphingopyxis]QXF11904.1 D-glycerate dehydrogenase [Sphingopyxis terrae subsp. terrae]
MPDSSRPKRPRVIVTRQLMPAVEARMAELFDVALSAHDHAFTKDELKAAVADCDVLVPTVTDEIDAEIIGAAGDRLKLIANFGAGVDHIDLAAARAKGIMVANTPGVFTEDTADMTMALILSVPRRLAEGEKLMRSGKWQGWAPSAMLGHRVGGKLLGIVGMGRIGLAVARRARAFGLSIHYHNRRRLPETIEEELGASYHASVDTLLRISDVVTIHCPHTAETHEMVSAARIGAMKPTAYLINTARGEIIDEKALIAALKTGRIAGAGLDVYTHEPAVDPDLLALDNVVLLPHLGSATIEGREASGEKVIANIRAWCDGHRPPDQVLEGWA